MRLYKILKPIEGERFSIRQKKLSRKDVKRLKKKDLKEYYGLVPGKYTLLYDKVEENTLMSDSYIEELTNYDFITQANGEVLIAGLGLGFVILQIQDKLAVKRILVIEKHKEIIDLVATQLPLNSKVKILNGDIFKFKPGQKFDTIYFDIWGKLSVENYKEIRTLHNTFVSAINKNNPNFYLDSWRRFDMQCMYERDKILKTN